MRRLLILTIFFLTFSISNAQKRIERTDSLRLNIITELNQKEIKSFFFLIKTSPSPIVIESEDSNSQKIITDFTGYVFWKENLKTYVQKFDSFGKFNAEELSNFKGFELLLQKLSIIKSENILPYTIRKKGKDTIAFSPNEYQNDLFFNVGSVEFEKHFRADVLIKNDYINRPEMENKSYSKNSDLQTIKFYNLCLIAIQNLETRKLNRI